MGDLPGGVEAEQALPVGEAAAKQPAAHRVLGQPVQQIEVNKLQPVALPHAPVLAPGVEQVVLAQRDGVFECGGIAVGQRTSRHITGEPVGALHDVDVAPPRRLGVDADPGRRDVEQRDGAGAAADRKVRLQLPERLPQVLAGLRGRCVRPQQPG